MTRSLDQALLQGADVSAMASANLLVNSFHTVSQENGSAAITAVSGKYTTDQWQGLQTGSWAGTWQQVSSPFASQPDIPYGLKLTITTASATLAAGDMIGVRQPIEGLNLARLLYGSANARPVTVAFMARASIATVGYFGLLSPNAANTAVVRSFVQRFALPANQDTFVSFTIPGDVASALVNASTINAGLYPLFSFGNGTTFQGTAGTWVAGEVRSGADVTNLAATVGNNIIISGAVMLPGIVPISQAMLPLLARPYDDELRKCQRYWQSGGFSILFQSTAATQFGSTAVYHTEKRVSPTITTSVGYSASIPTISTNVMNPANAAFRVYGQSNAANIAAESSGSWIANSRM